jgi:hypothetical protein
MTARDTPLGITTHVGKAGRKRTPLRNHRFNKLTPELSKKICDAVRAGNYISVAARYSGVSQDTVHEWIQRGRGEDPDRPALKIYRDFASDIDAAEAAAEVAAVLHWRAAMPKDWHSSEKWLERRQPERWGAVPPDQQRGSAYAGVQVNIGMASGQADAVGPGRVNLVSPLQSLLEENPELIAGTMQFLDHLLPVSPQVGAASANESPTIDGPVPTEPSEIYDAEPGSWRPMDGESDED